MGDSTVVVKITFKQIQSFLFAVPRLKAMLGANAILGEVVRIKLPALAKDCGSSSAGYNAACPYPTAIQEDPLTRASVSSFEKDDPENYFKLSGLMARDGGHFSAIFLNTDDAIRFENTARQFLLTKVPGLSFEVEQKKFASDSDTDKGTKSRFGSHRLRLPQFQICQETGTDVAVEKSGVKETWRSEWVKKLEEFGTKFYNQETKDIIGLLNKQMPGCQLKNPTDLKDFSDHGYIALIHADGNSIGFRQRIWTTQETTGSSAKDYLAAEARSEQFFHPMRVAVRCAVVQALRETYPEDKLEQYKKKKKKPYQFLMLGGDDLLLLCHPVDAFPFIINYAKALETSGIKIPFTEKDGQIEYRTISIGAGICIAQDDLPFHHMHGIAEKLATSAKSLYRSQLGDKDKDDMPPDRSVVDWIVSSSSWIGTPVDARKKTDLFRMNVGGQKEALVTAARPRFILNDEGDSRPEDLSSLENLYAAAKKIYGEVNDTAEKEVARSQLKRFPYKLKKGREISRIDYIDMPKTTRESLEEYFGLDGENLWHSIGDNGMSYYLTQFKDLVELFEINNLGTRNIVEGDNEE